MSIKFACGCGKAYKVPEKFSGKRIKCKQCGDPVRVPSESEGSVVSTRTSAVSKRSVVDSERVGQKSERRSKSRRNSSASTSGKSRRSSRQSETSGRSSRKKSARAGASTQRVTPVDLNEGNEIKKFERKRTENEAEFARGEGRLTYFEDGKPKKAFKINKNKEVTIGRNEGCTVSLPIASVSGEHVKVEYKLGTFIATDLQSSNGMLVNGRTVRRCSLNDGDIVQLGEAILRIDCG